MRYIDADALVKEVNENKELFEKERVYLEGLLLNAPTVKPIIDPSFITDLDAVKDWNICGYRVEDLVKLSRILRDRRIEDVDLRDYNNSFFDGYRKAYDEIHNSIKKMTDDLIEANNKFKGVEDN